VGCASELRPSSFSLNSQSLVHLAPLLLWYLLGEHLSEPNRVVQLKESDEESSRTHSSMHHSPMVADNCTLKIFLIMVTRYTISIYICFILCTLAKHDGKKGKAKKLLMGKIHKQEKGQKNKNRGERQKNSENQVTLDSIFGASKKHHLSNFVLYLL
jgi:hypothetical protein